jgi:putative transposase
LIRDLDAEFTTAFDAVFTPVDMRILKTPIQAPGRTRSANAGRQRPPRVPGQDAIAGERHLRLVLREYVDHYNTHRPHRAPQQNPPAGRAHPLAAGVSIRVLRRDRPGGLIHEYSQVA